MPHYFFDLTDEKTVHDFKGKQLRNLEAAREHVPKALQEERAERAKTARLRALRLAKEAAEKVGKLPKPTKKRCSAT